MKLLNEMPKIVIHPEADPEILAALVEREDVIILDRLPEFAHIDNFRFVMDTAPTFYANGTATARQLPTGDAERDAWNADVDARKAARRVRRAHRK